MVKPAAEPLSLAFTGAATTNFITNAASNASAGILTGTLTTGSTAGQIKVNVTDTDNTIAVGTYDLLGYTSASGLGYGTFSLGTVVGLSGRRTGQLINVTGATNYVALSVTGVSGSLFWTGGTNSNWTTSTSASELVLEFFTDLFPDRRCRFYF